MAIALQSYSTEYTVALFSSSLFYFLLCISVIFYCVIPVLLDSGIAFLKSVSGDADSKRLS